VGVGPGAGSDVDADALIGVPFAAPRPPRRYPVDVSRVRFIPPAVLKLRGSLPTGKGWSYKVKLDGFRIQLHKVVWAQPYSVEWQRPNNRLSDNCRKAFSV